MNLYQRTTIMVGNTKGHRYYAKKPWLRCKKRFARYFSQHVVEAGDKPATKAYKYLISYFERGSLRFLRDYFRSF